MSSFIIHPCKRVKGVISLAGDKSISHRALILSSLSDAKTAIYNFPFSDDCLVTLDILQSLGIEIKKKSSSTIFVYGKGLSGFKRPRHILQLKESGTSMRLFTGLLSAQDFPTQLDGSLSLRKRPMLRVIEPLSLMGAKIKAKKERGNLYLPIKILPSHLKAINWTMKIPSAQVKSAILLAGLYAKGKTVIYEPIPSRDHTERMLQTFRARIKKIGRKIILWPSVLVSPKKIVVPGDISSASFFIVLATLVRNSSLLIKNISLNPTRLGILNALEKMGARIRILQKTSSSDELAGDLIIKSSSLKGIVITEHQIPTLIDELPILMVAACFARGKSRFEGVEELRIKETDRIESMITNLTKMGAHIELKHKQNREVIEIEGTGKLKASKLEGFGDHRTVMSLVIAGLLADSSSEINDIDAVNKSFPHFFSLLNHLIAT